MRPTPFSLSGLLLWLILAVGAAVYPPMLITWQLLGLTLFFLASLDAWQVWRIPLVSAERQVSNSLPLGVWSDVVLCLHNATSTPLVIEIFDDYPIHCDLKGLPQMFTLPATAGIETHYRLCPQQRGAVQFTGIHLLIRSPWQFWKRYRYLPLVTKVRIYPNFATTTKYALLATENHLGQLGIRKIQRRGEGLEFHQLREYHAGDALRQIDWNATSRYKRLISKEYQDERDQQIVFLIDCGRRMLAQDGPLSHFDHTLNAILLLCYVALRQGDALGLLTFSGEHRWLAPRKGMKTMNVILNTVYDLQPSTKTSDYLWVAQELMKRLKKRSFVILVSNLRDEDSEELRSALQLLRNKHLVLLASLQERILNEILEQPVYTFEEALRHAATLDYLNGRQQTREAMKGYGVLYLDAVPEQLPVKLVNRYLEIKRSGVL